MFKILVLGSLIALTGCTKKISKEELSKAINENPQVITEAIEKNPVLFMDAIQKAAKSAQSGQAERQQLDEKAELEKSFKNPLVPNIRADELIIGNKDAKLTLVEYSDFECPFCSRGYTTIQALLKKYKGNIRFVYKHLPLDFHPQAMITAQYYEAIRLQSESKAVSFHDYIFEHQSELKNGKPFLDKLATKLGVNLTKLNKDLNSDAVKNRIAEDQREAAQFKMQGTPGFLINGVPVRGAYPPEYFDTIIAKIESSK